MKAINELWPEEEPFPNKGHDIIQYMKNKNVIKFLENIVNDTQFLLCFNFLKINGIVKKIKKNQILAWQIMNIYYLFQTFRKFIYIREPINDKK